MTIQNYALGIVTLALVACIAIPETRHESGHIVPVAINAIAFLATKQGNERDTDNKKRLR
ncbi:hypothetical protein [Nostoc sp. 'Peltigera membranacea cyanobiont' N6]|uniref:hypothetical protein n=1 Tax=Nostoc sp. 'Peltigera membranacea cyanobiont' N6 TaxID=1261031 RepID=UPI000CF2FF00|nr:hypothetical protein [Nostoc sp. 'Peltigera membranacea cyanobiont' N6]